MLFFARHAYRVGHCGVLGVLLVIVQVEHVEVVLDVRVEKVLELELVVGVHFFKETLGSFVQEHDVVLLGFGREKKIRIFDLMHLLEMKKNLFFFFFSITNVIIQACTFSLYFLKSDI